VLSSRHHRAPPPCTRHDLRRPSGTVSDAPILCYTRTRCQKQHDPFTSPRCRRRYVRISFPHAEGWGKQWPAIIRPFFGTDRIIPSSRSGRGTDEKALLPITARIQQGFRSGGVNFPGTQDRAICVNQHRSAIIRGDVHCTVHHFVSAPNS
jgi:hypothetical protein